MQDKYVGDIGDYAKFSMLRALSAGRRLGVSWYLRPDDGTNDGKHIGYLCCPETWQQFDECTFDILRDIVCSGQRKVSVIERSGLLPDGTKFWNCRLDCQENRQADWRHQWFKRSQRHPENCGLIFADPDNGLREDKKFKPGQKEYWKSIPDYEARELGACGRPVVIYHHNSRRKGGHGKEVCDWLQTLGGKTRAIRWRVMSPRTFFILNCAAELERRAKSWCEGWQRKGKQVEFMQESGD